VKLYSELNDDINCAVIHFYFSFVCGSCTFLVSKYLFAEIINVVCLMTTINATVYFGNDYSFENHFDALFMNICN